MCQRGLLNKCVCPITLRGSLRASRTSFQRISANWQQEGLSGSVYCAYVRLGGRALIGSNAQDLQRKPIAPACAVCPVCFPGNSCIFGSHHRVKKSWKGIPLKMIFPEWTAERRGEILSAAVRGREPETKIKKKNTKMCNTAAAERRCDDTVQVTRRHRFFILFFFLTTVFEE